MNFDELMNSPEMVESSSKIDTLRKPVEKPDALKPLKEGAVETVEMAKDLTPSVAGFEAVRRVTKSTPMGFLGAAGADTAAGFLTGKDDKEYDYKKFGISLPLEPILPISVDIGRIPFYFNKSVFGTPTPIPDAAAALFPPSPPESFPTPTARYDHYSADSKSTMPIMALPPR